MVVCPRESDSRPPGRYSNHNRKSIDDSVPLLPRRKQQLPLGDPSMDPSTAGLPLDHHDALDHDPHDHRGHLHLPVPVALVPECLVPALIIAWNCLLFVLLRKGSRRLLPARCQLFVAELLATIELCADCSELGEFRKLCAGHLQTSNLV